MTAKEITLVKLGFKKVFVPQVRIHRHWFTPENEMVWCAAKRMFLRLRCDRDSHCETMDEAAAEIKDVAIRLEDMKSDDKMGKDAKIIATRIISRWQYFGKVEKDTEKVEMIEE